MKKAAVFDSNESISKNISQSLNRIRDPEFVAFPREFEFRLTAV